MRGFFSVFFIFYFLLNAPLAEGQSRRQPLTASVGGGAVNFNPITPAADIRMNPGSYFFVGGEKGFGFLHMYLEAALEYLKASGNLNYNFTSGTNINYAVSNVNYSLDDLGGAVGLRLKLVEYFPLRPYVEGGGTGGYLQLTYDNSLKTPAVLAQGNDFKTLEGVLTFGAYLEGGFEMDVAPAAGIRIAVRYSDASTRPVDTLRKQILHYTAQIYYGGIYLGF